MNTLGVPAVSSHFINLKSPDQLIKLYENGFSKSNQPFVLGGGSNILFLNNPSRPIIKVSIRGIEIVKERSDSVTVEVGAGENWHQFVTWAVEHNLGGLENLALIPGTVGASPIQNIGAYGVEFEEVFESLNLFDLRDGIFKSFDRENCRFGYRDSVFKQELNGHIVITSVRLLLSKIDHRITDSYTALRSYLSERNIKAPTIKDIYKAVIDIRRSKLPDPSSLGNAGSFFKNPVVAKKKFQVLKDKFEEMPFYELDVKNVKIPAGWLIEQTGWKGKRIGDVGTYINQALVIVNHGNATGSEILQFSQMIQQSVKQEFGIDLVPEVNIVQ